MLSPGLMPRFGGRRGERRLRGCGGKGRRERKLNVTAGERRLIYLDNTFLPDGEKPTSHSKIYIRLFMAPFHSLTDCGVCVFHLDRPSLWNSVYEGTVAHSLLAIQKGSSREVLGPQQRYSIHIQCRRRIQVVAVIILDEQD